MSFGSDLWDQLKHVETYTEYNIQMMDKVNEFMKTIAAAEAAYSTSILKIVKQYKDEFVKRQNDKNNAVFNRAVLGSSFNHGWMFLLTEAEGLAEVHQTIATTLDTDLRKTVKYKARDNEKANKMRFDEIRKANLELKKSIDNLERVQQKYEKATKDMELARVAFENSNKDMNASKKDIDRLRTDAEKKAILAQDAATGYRQTINETNDIKHKHFNEIIPGILDIVQKEDEDNRISFVKTALFKYADLFSTEMPKIQRSFKQLTQTFDTINASGDSELFISAHRSGESHPADFQMSDITDAAGASSGPKGLSFLKGMSSAKKEDDNIEEQIIALPGKQGKRKATDRVKVLEKDMLETDKKKQGVTSLITVYKEKPSNSDPKLLQDLMDQRTNLEKKLEILQTKRHKLLVYVSVIDNTPTPDINDLPIGLGETGRKSSKVGLDVEVFSGTIPVQPIIKESTLGTCKVLFDFEAAPSSHEMSVKTGQVLEILEKQDDGWWRCRTMDGSNEGFVPA